MPSGDNHLVVNLIMIELFGTILFLAILTICLYIKRYFVRKSLGGLKALITNGDTKLSQELAERLSSKHNCHVILVKGKTTSGLQNQPDSIPPQTAGISVLHCDILDNEDLERLSQIVQDTFNGIDIVIDNATKGIFNAVNKDDCRAFIDGTSEKLRTTINMLMHFIPKLKYSKCGHFVTIQPIISNQKPLLSSYREIKELINLLSDNQQSTFALDIFNQQKIRLTTVLWNCDDTTTIPVAYNGHNSNNNNQADIEQISERILDGIRADRSVVHINKSGNLIGPIRNFFQKKKSNSNDDCNGHSKVR
ncbi:uncharacterized protein LOC129565893 [Sitodiplosis mosellana]|uniref:uncharacterized protein LOC129565893 n=1 Tax=Sitodiplosis mosellana TaxID=263140 RepID=UPI002443DE3D|nr:uncharacterized protein LOC129565893 [Sitodiplosis mosellana]